MCWRQPVKTLQLTGLQKQKSLESQCDKRANSQTNSQTNIVLQSDDHVQDKIAAWTKAKKEIDHYTVKMSKVTNSFNFETKAKPTEAKKVECENLDIILRVPKSVTFKI